MIKEHQASLAQQKKQQEQQPALANQQQAPQQQPEGVTNPLEANQWWCSAWMWQPNQWYINENFESIPNDDLQGLLSDDAFLATLSFHTLATTHETTQLAAFFRQQTDDNSLLLDWHPWHSQQKQIWMVYLPLWMQWRVLMTGSALEYYSMPHWLFV